MMKQARVSVFPINCKKKKERKKKFCAVFLYWTTTFVWIKDQNTHTHTYTETRPQTWFALEHELLSTHFFIIPIKRVDKYNVKIGREVHSYTMCRTHAFT